MSKKTKTENAPTLLKIDKGIAVPTRNGVYGASLEATLKLLKPVAVSTDLKEAESIEVPKERRYTLKARLAKFPSGTFATKTNANGSKRIWKIATV